MIASALMLTSLASAVELDVNETDPRAVMTVVENRDLGDKMRAELHIEVTDSAGRSRTRDLTLSTMVLPEAHAQLYRFTAPSDVAGAAMLAIDSTSGADQQWLFLPSVGEAKELSGGDRSGSFMGTDLALTDLTGKDPGDYTYTMLDANSDVSGEAAWLIEAKPSTPAERNATGYLKVHVWVSKKKQIPIQTKAWVVAGKRIKYTRFLDPIKHGGAWWPRTIEVQTVHEGALQSTSVVSFGKVRFDQSDITAELFTPEALATGL